MVSFVLQFGVVFPLVIFSVLACAYYCVLAVASLFCQQSLQTSGDPPDTRFLVLIPAHNEAVDISQTVSRCHELDYPKSLSSIWVVADNCIDETAETARRAGARVLVRNDKNRRGKGAALSWSIRKLLSEQDFDSLVVVDADCMLNQTALRVFDENRRAGHRVQQADNLTQSDDRSSIGYVSALANSMENQLFYAPKSAMGLFVDLRGTGMCIDRSILQPVGFDDNSICEDRAFTLKLLRAGIPVKYDTRAKVFSAAASSPEQFTTQRSRWIGGTISLMYSQALPLILEGIAKFRFHLIDAGWTLMVQVRTLVGLIAMLATGGAVAVNLATESVFSRWLVTAMALVWAGWSLYLLLGISKFGVTRHQAYQLALMPLVMFRFGWITLRAAFMPQQFTQTWKRTPRS